MAANAVFETHPKRPFLARHMRALGLEEKAIAAEMAPQRLDTAGLQHWRAQGTSLLQAQNESDATFRAVAQSLVAEM